MSVGELCSALIGVGTVGAGTWKFAIKPTHTLFKRLLVLATTAEANALRLDEIHTQFKPNGGTTMRDVLDRIDLSTTSAQGRISALIEYHDVAAFEANNKGEFIWVSPKWCEIFESLPADARGNGWIVSVHPEDRERLFREWMDAVAQERAFRSVFRVGSMENGYKRVLACASIMHDSKTRPAGYSGTVVFVSEDDKKVL